MDGRDYHLPINRSGFITCWSDANRSSSGRMPQLWRSVRYGASDGWRNRSARPCCPRRAVRPTRCTYSVCSWSTTTGRGSWTPTARIGRRAVSERSAAAGPIGHLAHHPCQSEARTCGRSYCTTQWTESKLSPRAAMSVQSNTPALRVRKRRKTSTRSACSCTEQGCIKGWDGRADSIKKPSICAKGV